MLGITYGFSSKLVEFETPRGIRGSHIVASVFPRGRLGLFDS